jgi:hypothetical protein
VILHVSFLKAVKNHSPLPTPEIFFTGILFKRNYDDLRKWFYGSLELFVKLENLRLSTDFDSFSWSYQGRITFKPLYFLTGGFCAWFLVSEPRKSPQSPQKITVSTTVLLKRIIKRAGRFLLVQRIKRAKKQFMDWYSGITYEDFFPFRENISYKTDLI